jgi:uncharacterized protein YbjT (DUF2867 family)
MLLPVVLLAAAQTTHGIAINRRQALGGGAAAAAFAADPAFAASKPIAVIGSGGRTGSLCVAACLKRGLAVRALSRSGSSPPGVDASAALLSIAECDVRDASTINVAGAGAVIYAASGSKKGGSPHDVDNLGVVNAARACIAAKVPRLVVISSTAVTRPNSLGYKFTDVYGRIMGEKKLGEDGVYATYASSDLAYTIIRPGGLEEPKENIIQGPGALEISQGDALAGIISRTDLAEAAVEAAALGASPVLKDASFELYYTKGAQACEGKFKKLLADESFPRLHGDSYGALFKDVRRDGSYTVPG